MTSDAVAGYTVVTDLPQIGFFETSNETISHIFRNIVWGTRDNYLHMPTDCPQRDERMGWQGDRSVGSKGEMYIFDNVSLYNKWMQDVEDSQRDDGNVSDVAPAYYRNYRPNVTWPSTQFFVAQNLATMFGDYSAIVKHFDSRDRWINFMLALRNEDGTISKDNYGDRCVPPERPELIHSEDPLRKTDGTLLATSYMIHDLRVSADFADYLGKSDAAKNYRETADAMQEAFHRRFYDAEKGLYDNGSQTSFILPLAFGLVPETERAKVVANLVNCIKNKTNGHIGVGLIGAQFINRVLSNEGRVDLPYAFATYDDYPSWGYMIKKGATTIWELWNGDTADPAMNSHNHVMLVGDLAIWFFEYLAGVKADPENPGFKHIVMRPNVVGDLTYVNASYDSAMGVIESSWKLDRESGQFVWNIVVPTNAVATVFVPTTDPESLSVSASRLISVSSASDGARSVDYDAKTEPVDARNLEKKLVDDRVVFELGGGRYVIAAELK